MTISLRGSLVLAALTTFTRAAGPPSSGGGGGGGAGASSPAEKAQEAAQMEEFEDENDHRAKWTLIILACCVALFMLYNLIIYSVEYIRRLTCMNNEKQMYFRFPNITFGRIKRYLTYAPLLKKSHHDGIYLFGRVYIGILPTRFQSIFLLAVIGFNIYHCVVKILWHASSATMLQQFRNRTGTMAVVNLIPLVIMGGRNNPLITLLNIPFDIFNLVHRWFGRIVVAEALAHMVAWAINEVNTTGWKSVGKALQSSHLIITGFVAVVASLVIVVQSQSALRRAFYETFLHLHIILVILLIVATYLHLNGMPAQKWLKVVIAAWAAERLFRTSLLLYRNVGAGGTKAIIEALPGDAMRVTFSIARPWSFRPGQHMYVTMPSVGLWTSHPFSVAWSEAAYSDVELPEKGSKGFTLPSSRHDIYGGKPKTQMSAVMRRRNGFTDALYRRAANAPEGRIVLNALTEGPYGGHSTLHSYGTVMMFAGGVGITHQVPFVRDLISGFSNGTCAARKIVLIWVIQSPEHLEWIRPWMTSILAMDRRREILRIQLFVTRPRSTKEIHSPSATVQMFPGRPNVDTLVGLEVEGQVGAMGVSACGTGSLSDDVRRAVLIRQGVSNIDFVDQSFSW